MDVIALAIIVPALLIAALGVLAAAFYSHSHSRR